MNTHDKIKLPPLPVNDHSYNSGLFAPLWGKSKMEAYARQAVEADRQQHDRMLAHEWIRPALGLSEDAPYRFDFYTQEIEKLRNDSDYHKRMGDPANESHRVYLHDEGHPEYLDGALCQYVIVRGKPYPHGDLVAFVYEKEDAERIVAALNNEPSRREPVAWKIIKRVHNSDPVFTVADPTDVLMSKYIPLYTTPQPAESVKHDLYKKGDKGAPEQILDRNGDVVLDCCKRCGKAEIELSEPCIAEPVKILIDNQEPLGEEFQRVLDEHSWDLYVKTTEPVKVDAKASVPSDSSTHKWKRIEEYSKEMDGKKIDIYLGDFLLYCPQLEDEENNGVVIGYYSEPYKGWYTSETLEEVFPTHFMPLPEKPL